MIDGDWFLHDFLLHKIIYKCLFDLFQEWYDEFLTWDPAEHGGVNYTVVRADDIWLPDIYIQNR